MSERIEESVEFVGGPACGRKATVLRGARWVEVPLYAHLGRYERIDANRCVWREHRDGTERRAGERRAKPAGRGRRSTDKGRTEDG